MALSGTVVVANRPEASRDKSGLMAIANIKAAVSWSEIQYFYLSRVPDANAQLQAAPVREDEL